MNERIKELMLQAGFNQMGIWKIIGIEQYHEKFAELIVRECLEEIWYDMTPKQISDNIKRKFGVEE